MSQGTRVSVLSRVLPALAVALVALAFVVLSDRSPTRLTLELAWAGPDSTRPFGSGDAGVDLFALVFHATFRALGLAAVVALFGFTLGTPLGTTAGLAGGKL